MGPAILAELLLQIFPGHGSLANMAQQVTRGFSVTFGNAGGGYRSLAQEPSSVNVQQGTVDEAGCVAGQKQHRACHLLGLTVA